MNQQEIDKQASIELLLKAVNSDSTTMADILIESAHRLDNSVPVDEYRCIALNNWLEREYSKRSTK